MTLTAMDFIRAALANAQADGMSVDDLCRMAEHALAPGDFGQAVNMLSNTIPQDTPLPLTPKKK